MHDSRPWTNPARDLARSHMELVPNIHRVHVAIVSGDDETHLMEFEDPDAARMLEQTIPDFIRATGAFRVILSSPDRRESRDGVIVAILDRTLERFYVPIVRITNAELLVGDFRPINAVAPPRYRPIFDALVRNWLQQKDC